VIECIDPATVERYRSGCALGRLGKADEIASVVLFLKSCSAGRPSWPAWMRERSRERPA
jgi:NAD(P)-dependent dehydrogenase (short-subunit alcohol dehydrogenase family)